LVIGVKGASIDLSQFPNKSSPSKDDWEETSALKRQMAVPKTGGTEDLGATYGGARQRPILMRITSTVAPTDAL
jgi:hypothetical protein